MDLRAEQTWKGGTKIKKHSLILVCLSILSLIIFYSCATMMASQKYEFGTQAYKNKGKEKGTGK